MKFNEPVLLALAAALGTHCHRTPSAESSPPPATAPAPIPGHASTSGVQGASPPPSDPEVPPPLDPPAPVAEFREGARWLPQGVVAGWQQSGGVTRADPTSLFQVMDGAAASYERFGLRTYAKTEYRQPGTFRVASVEVYEFADALGAFGRYAAMLTDGRDPSTLEHQAVRVGAGGYAGSTQIAFWKGRFLVQINVQDTSEQPDERALTLAAHEALPRIAGAVEHGLSDDSTLPASPLPTDGLVWGGSSYVPDEVLGVSHSGAGWVGFYRAPDGRPYRLAVLSRATPAEAGETLHAFHAVGAMPLAGVGDEAFTATLSGGINALVARHATTIFVVADAGLPGAASPDPSAKAALLRAAMSPPTH